MTRPHSRSAALVATGTFALALLSHPSHARTALRTESPQARSRGRATVRAAVRRDAPPELRQNITHGCIDRFDPSADYYPDKVTVEDAVNFSVTYHRSYKVVNVQNRADGLPERYVLVQCGAPAPPLDGELQDAQIVRTPVTSLYAISTTHVALLADLTRLEVLAGVSTKKFLTGVSIPQRTTKDDVREFAPAGVIDAELVVSQHPSLLMTGGSASAELTVIRQAGIPVVVNHEWLEPTALARAEWVKYMALLLNEERAAHQFYAGVKRRYLALKATAAAVPAASRPTVMTGRGTGGEFVISGGRSYTASLIADAGGRYVWSDDTATGSETVGIEAQLRRAAGADIWINGGGWPNLAAMVNDDPRYSLFKAYRTGQVWVYERRVNGAGANDYWSSGVSRPDLILADLVKIFHPQLLPDYEFQWYLQVPR